MKFDEMINRVVLGDSLLVIKDIPDESIDFVLTDPPYNVSYDYDSISDSMSDTDYSDWCHKWLSEINRVLKKGHYAVVFTGDLKSYWVFNALMRSGLVFHHFLKWYKPTCQRALSGTVLFNRVELAFICSNGKPNTKLINRKVIYQDVLTYNNTTNADKGAVDHNARRPVPLYKHIIAGFSNENDLILDLFLGTGTTAIASKELGRRWIGIEISPKYVGICNKGLSQSILF